MLEQSLCSKVVKANTASLGKAVTMRELLYKAAEHYKQGKNLADQGDVRAALQAYREALRDLHAVQPQRMRDVLLAHVYLARYQLAVRRNNSQADSDLRMGYSYARTTKEPVVRELAEKLWKEAVHYKRQQPRLSPRRRR